MVGVGKALDPPFPLLCYSNTKSSIEELHLKDTDPHRCLLLNWMEKDKQWNPWHYLSLKMSRTKPLGTSMVYPLDLRNITSVSRTTHWLSISAFYDIRMLVVCDSHARHSRASPHQDHSKRVGSI